MREKIMRIIPLERLADLAGRDKLPQTPCAHRRVSYSPRPFSDHPQPLLFTMSQHSSLKTAGSVGTKRSVLKRGERIKLLKSRGQWKEGRLPTNLPKTKPE